MYLVSDSLGIQGIIYKVLGIKRQEHGISKHSEAHALMSNSHSPLSKYFFSV